MGDSGVYTSRSGTRTHAKNQQHGSDTWGGETTRGREFDFLSSCAITSMSAATSSYVPGSAEAKAYHRAKMESHLALMRDNQAMAEDHRAEADAYAAEIEALQAKMEAHLAALVEHEALAECHRAKAEKNEARMNTNICELPTEIAAMIIRRAPALSLTCRQMADAFDCAWARESVVMRGWMRALGTCGLDPLRLRWSLLYVLENQIKNERDRRGPIAMWCIAVYRTYSRHVPRRVLRESLAIPVDERVAVSCSRIHFLVEYNDPQQGKRRSAVMATDYLVQWIPDVAAPTTSWRMWLIEDIALRRSTIVVHESAPVVRSIRKWTPIITDWGGWNAMEYKVRSDMDSVRWKSNYEAARTMSTDTGVVYKMGSEAPFVATVSPATGEVVTPAAVDTELAKVSTAAPADMAMFDRMVEPPYTGSKYYRKIYANIIPSYNKLCGVTHSGPGAKYECLKYLPDLAITVDKTPVRIDGGD